MPRAVYILALGIFAMVTSEFVVAGLMPQIARGLDATIPQIGYLITVFALAMALGGPLLSVTLLRLHPRTALLTLFAVFLTGNILAATATGYTAMAAARIITGAASQAFFGVALSLSAQLAPTHLRGRAIAVVMNGLMLGTLLGLPASTLIGEHYGWRAAFWAIAALTLTAAAATLALVPRGQRTTPAGGLRTELRAFTNPRLWLALSTSTLIIGATFSAFSYLNPILTQTTGLPPATVPWLLVAYGAATVIGNTVVGRLADRHTLPVLLTGLAANTLFLTAFALLAHHPLPAITAMIGIGLVGVTTNPAMITRVQRTANDRPLVTTVHSSFITLGVIIGSAAGGIAITAHGLRGPLWLGAALALTGIATLIPDLLRRRTTPPPAPATHPAPTATTR
ncbi:MFS transporter [Streptomonospora nanhaiensis]|uniref:MFS transporter n=1 Tax=Streptomonospora nanhaiensis TaxID=1323731 RepID=UPI001C99D968|nr:MFS transporter [Streptomonospora nanhaiensis]MBX9389248.1 MFS transporter [Streptomonospora nanhaiensis]